MTMIDLLVTQTYGNFASLLNVTETYERTMKYSREYNFICGRNVFAIATKYGYNQELCKWTIRDDAYILLAKIGLEMRKSGEKNNGILFCYEISQK